MSKQRVLSESEQKQERKRMRREEWAKQFRMYNPPTTRYRRLRTIWAIAVAAAIVFFIVAFSMRSGSTTYLSFAFLALADGSLIFAAVIDFAKIRKERQRYQDEMTSKKSKSVRAAEKKRKAEENSRKAAGSL